MFCAWEWLLIFQKKNVVHTFATTHRHSINQVYRSMTIHRKIENILVLLAITDLPWCLFSALPEEWHLRTLAVLTLSLSCEKTELTFSVPDLLSSAFVTTCKEKRTIKSVYDIINHLRQISTRIFLYMNDVKVIKRTTFVLLL